MRNGSGPRRPLPPIGKHLYDARRALHLTQAAFGARLGVTKRTVQRWELCWTRPSSGDVARILDQVDAMDVAVGVTLRTAVTGVTPPPPPRTAAEEKQIIADLIHEMADTLDVSPRRAREAMLRAAERLESAGMRAQHVVAALTERPAPTDSRSSA